MNIFMTGGTGFIGNTLTRKLVEQGHHVTVLTRKTVKAQVREKGITLLEGDPTKAGNWQKQVAEHEVFVNLAGASIFCRWTKSAKAMMRDSRILTTKNLVEALADRKGKETTLISTSAVGFYGFHGDEELDEHHPGGDDYLALLSKDWEAAALQAEPFGVRVLICRFGIVLGAHGGALGQMRPLFRMGLGSPLGSGDQWFSWIHEQDLINIYLFLIGNNDLAGLINCTAPEPVTNRVFTKALGEALGKPTFMPSVPGFILRLVKGEFGNVLLKGQKVLPKKLSEVGFRFQFPNVNAALGDLEL